MTRLAFLTLTATLAMISVVLCRTPASAQTAEPENGSANTEDRAWANAEDRPWAKGISADEQRAALQLFSEGNSMLRDSLFLKAVEKYQEAIGHWPHPAIYYNLSLALLNLDRPLEVHQSLKKTLLFGAAPLGEDKFEHAQSYLRLVEGQLATIVVACDLEGARVTLDGHELFVGPGRHQSLVRVGEHTVVAAKQGYVTTTVTRMLAPAKTETFAIRMFTDAELTRYRRKWTVWKPWTVVGGGGALLVLGGTLHLLARSKFQTYDDRIEACGGCVPSANLESKKDNANILQAAAITSYVLGAAVVAGGAFLVYVNRAQPYRVDPSELNQPVSVVPVLAPDSAGIAASFRF